MLVFVPLTTAELAAWARTGRHHPMTGHAVTASLCSAFGFGPADTEDAEHTVLHIAGLAALLRGGRRLVAVAEAPATAAPSAEFGDVRVGDVGFAAVTALFADLPAAGVEPIRERLTHDTVEAAWDDPAVQRFLSENELSWYGPTEWRTLVQ